MDRTPHFETAETNLEKAYAAQVARGTYLDYPMIVSIETFAKCNAACSFCPYPDLERIGTKLEAPRVRGLIDEIATFPIPPARLNFSRVNEPFLDPGLFEYLAYADAVLPETKLVLFSNGQTLTERTIDRLDEISAFDSLVISFNEHDPGTYHAVMGIDQALTVKRLDALHDRFEHDALNFNVRLSRVGTSDEQDNAFEEWCARRFPAFPVSVAAKFDWIGMERSGEASLAPDAGCLQWFSLHILATGASAFCCIDGSGLVEGSHIDEQSLFDIYNHAGKRNARAALMSRKAMKGCATCLHGMAAKAYQKQAGE